MLMIGRLPAAPAAHGREALGHRPGPRRGDDVRVPPRLLGHAERPPAARAGRVQVRAGRRREDAAHADGPRGGGGLLHQGGLERAVAPGAGGPGAPAANSSIMITTIIITTTTTTTTATTTQERPPLGALIDVGALITGLSNLEACIYKTYIEYVCVCMYIHIYIYIYIFLSLSLYIYIYIYICLTCYIILSCYTTT